MDFWKFQSSSIYNQSQIFYIKSYSFGCFSRKQKVGNSSFSSFFRENWKNGKTAEIGIFSIGGSWRNGSGRRALGLQRVTEGSPSPPLARHQRTQLGLLMRLAWLPLPPPPPPPLQLLPSPSPPPSPSLSLCAPPADPIEPKNFHLSSKE